MIGSRYFQKTRQCVLISSVSRVNLLSFLLSLIYLQITRVFYFFYISATGRPHDASKHGQAVLDVLEKQDVRGWEREFRVTGKYWKRKWGADHILTLGAPVTGLRHPKVYMS